MGLRGFPGYSVREPVRFFPKSPQSFACTGVSTVISPRLKSSSYRIAAKLSGDNCWIKLGELIPRDAPEVNYAAQLCKGFGVPAKPFRRRWAYYNQGMSRAHG